MEKQINGKLLHKLRSALLVSVLLLLLQLALNYSSFNGSSSLVNNNSDPDHCLGRYVYVHNLPSRFNDDLLENCGQKLPRWARKFNLCSYMENFGFGLPVEDSDDVLTSKSWYSTNQFLLEVIFHYRMKNYECLTDDSSLASAIYVPYYAGIDLRRYLWGFKTSVRDANGIDLVKWLAGRPEWKRMWGRDHFLIAGRISRDFRRESDKKSDWGSKFRFLPESKNMSMLSIEASPWSNDLAIPYPTYFHPSTDTEIFQWQDKVRGRKRPYLFSFVGAPRSKSKASIRGEVINQCLASTKLCKFLNCDSHSQSCENPINVMDLFQNSVFCLQPPGDSFTRRSIFDSILAGCIPVFFHPGSAYTQYLWHLPKNHTKYSVFISSKDLRRRKVRINETLLHISKDEELAMREEVIRLIPQIIYADPRSRLENLEDAFDLTVKGILERIETFREEAAENPRIGFEEKDNNRFTFHRIRGET